MLAKLFLALLLFTISLIAFGLKVTLIVTATLVVLFVALMVTGFVLFIKAIISKGEREAAEVRQLYGDES